MYAEMMRAIDYVARTVAARIVRVFKRLWAVVVGKMPSGAWMTSHGDSWILALWFYMFGIMQISKAPIEDRERMEQELVLRVIIMIVYGDDQVLAMLRNETVPYFNIEQFTIWCKVYLNVILRDVMHDIPYVVETRNGYAQAEGVIFLKHFNARNKSTLPGQSYYLPFRNMVDYQIKSVWGRECKDRDIYDVILSVIGHSYGTYGSNYDAYSWLKHMYVSSFTLIGNTPGETLGTAVSRAHTNSDFVKKMRQADIQMEDLRKGFPTWETLVKKNVYDDVYHSQVREDFVEHYR